jgi:hypothetical protein
MKRLAILSALAATTLVIACGSSKTTSPSSGPDAGSGGASGSSGSTAKDLGAGDPGAGGVRFAASGEALALTGYAFPPAQAGDPAFFDGWAVEFKRLLVTVANVTLSDNPDKVPGDESQTDGVVARLAGPWAFDLSRSDPTYLPGKGGPGELAVPFASISADNNGKPLKTDGTRYAFGFEVVAATTAAKVVNLDSAGATDYQDMVKSGCTVLYVGHASFKGNKADPTCYPADRHGFPDEVDFRLCFKSPTSYVNCQNPDNHPAKSFPNEEEQRGVALKADASVIAQLTFHTDHPFWDSVLHDSPAHFDQFAARSVAPDAGVASVTLDNVRGVDYTAYTDKGGSPLEWRYCAEPPTDVHAKLVGPMKFDPQSVPAARGGDPASGLRDYYDFATYNQSTQGHLNSNGLCFVKRSYPSPP